jgi:putative oxidoreductase
MCEQAVSHFALLAGRVLVSHFFLLGGLVKLIAWHKSVAQIESQGLPSAELLLMAAVIIELGAGLSVLLGCKARWGAALLAVYFVPVTLWGHDFWAHQGAIFEQQMQFFLKNVAIVGGLVFLAATGPGRYSLDVLDEESEIEFEVVQGRRTAAEPFEPQLLFTPLPGEVQGGRRQSYLH